MMPEETPRTFTPEHQQALYEIVKRCLAAPRYSQRGLQQLEKDARYLLDAIASTQALATPQPATEPAQGKRYVVRAFYTVKSGKGYAVLPEVADYESATIDNLPRSRKFLVNGLEAAQAEADRLNAGAPGSTETGG